MEWKIGEIKQVNGEWYQCVVAIQGCRECSFRTQDYCTRHSECLSEVRSDGMSVIFKKLEKVGEPFYTGFYCSWVQKYKLYENNATGEYPKCHFGADYVLIEIKQTKEDMEEKKLNLKPFDLEAAKAGKPVCTRDGRKARTICFDRDWDMHIVALVSDPLGESVHYYLSNGKVDFDKQNDEDLMMLPEKKEGWAVIFADALIEELKKRK